MFGSAITPLPVFPLGKDQHHAMAIGSTFQAVAGDLPRKVAAVASPAVQDKHQWPLTVRIMALRQPQSPAALTACNGHRAIEPFGR